MPATHSLVIKDGNSTTQAISANSGTFGFIPEHTISGSVAVTASSTYPVFVTGAVSISQPVNVDLVVGDTITASIANTGFAQAIEAVTQSYNSAGGYGKFNVKLTGSSTVTIDNTAATNAFMALSGANLNDKLAVQLTGSSVVRAGNYDALLVRTTGSEVLVTNPGISAMIDSITGSSNGDRPLYVNVSGADSFSQKFFDHAMVAISHSYYSSVGGASNYLGVKFPQEYRNVVDPYHNALYVTTTGSEVSISGTPTVNLGNVVTYYQSVPVVATQLTGNSIIAAGNHEALITTVTGTTIVSFGNTTPNFTASMENPIAVKLPNQVFVTASLNEVTKVGYPEGSALVVKVTASNQDVYQTQLSNVSTTGFSGGSALVVKVTSSNQDVYQTSLSNVSTYGYNGGAALITKLTGAGTSENDKLWITGSVSSNTTVSDGLKVELSGTNVKQISNSSSNTYLQTSIAPVATGSTLKVFAPPNWGGSVPSGDPNVIIFDWNSSESGSACAASSSVNRKSLTVFNSSPHYLYMIIGLPWGGEATNGFSLYQTNQPPNMFSFILYPSGSYFAEPHNVGMRHGIYLVSSSVDNGTRIMVTETY